MRVWHASVFVRSLVLQVTSTNVDIASVAPQYRLYKTDQVQSVIDRL